MISWHPNWKGNVADVSACQGWRNARVSQEQQRRAGGSVNLGVPAARGVCAAPTVLCVPR